MISQNSSLIISDYLDEFKNKDIIIYAIKIAVNDNVRDIKYIEAILNNWKNANITTLEEAVDFTKKFNDYKENKTRSKVDSKNNKETTLDRLNRLGLGEEE